MNDLVYHIQWLEETDSTNSEAKRRQDDCPEGSVFASKRQTGGRGRLGRQWHSEDGGLYFSLLLYPPGETRLQPGLITLTAGVAVVSGLSALTGLPLGLKWPNDVYVNGKKLCGILAESSFTGDAAGAVILGVGVNVNTCEFPAELRDKACSILTETGRMFPIESALEAVLEAFRPLYGQLLHGNRKEILRKYETQCLIIGKPVILTNLNGDGDCEGTALGVDAQGRLRLRLPDGSSRLYASGEVTVKSIRN